MDSSNKPQKDRRIKTPKEDRRIKTPKEDRRIKTSKEDRRIKTPKEDRRIKTPKKDSEISHFSHKRHKLRFEHSGFPFICNGCKEVGIGSHYKCSICNYNLHMSCAINPRSIFHPFFPKCSFQFLPRPPGNKPRFCNACENDVTGFVYHCTSSGFDLHPCCAKLPMVLENGEVKLYLYPKVDSPCQHCKQKVRSWSYTSLCKRYNLHVACVRKILVERWPEIYMGRNNRKTEIGIPRLENRHNRTGSKGNATEWCEMVGTIVRIVISALLGDPTGLIVASVGSLLLHARKISM